MPSGTPYPRELRAQVMAALVAGASVREAANQFGIPKATVQAWRRDVRNANMLAQPEKRDELGELVAGYLREVLETLAAQSRFARDESWLRQQNASDLAIFHGVLTDKAIRILAALQPPDDETIVDV